MGEREFDIYQERVERVDSCADCSMLSFNFIETFQWTLPIAKFKRLDQNREKKVEVDFRCEYLLDC